MSKIEFTGTDGNVGTFNKKSLIATVASSSLGAIDTVGQSTRLWGDTDVENVLRTINPALGRNYSNNKDGARALGDILTMGTIAFKIPKAVGWGGKILRSSDTVGKAFGSNGNKLVRSVARTATAEDTTNGIVRLISSERAKQAALGAPIVATQRTKQLQKELSKTQWGKSALDNAAFETVSYALLNQSDLLYEDMTVQDIAKWTALGVGLERFGRGLISKNVLAKDAQNHANVSGKNFQDFIKKEGGDLDFLSSKEHSVVNARALTEYSKFLKTTDVNGDIDMANLIQRNTGVIDNFVEELMIKAMPDDFDIKQQSHKNLMDNILNQHESVKKVHGVKVKLKEEEVPEVNFITENGIITDAMPDDLSKHKFAISKQGVVTLGNKPYTKDLLNDYPTSKLENQIRFKQIEHFGNNFERSQKLLQTKNMSEENFLEIALKASKSVSETDTPTLVAQINNILDHKKIDFRLDTTAEQPFVSLADRVAANRITHTLDILSQRKANETVDIGTLTEMTGVRLVDFNGNRNDLMDFLNTISTEPSTLKDGKFTEDLLPVVDDLYDRSYDPTVSGNFKPAILEYHDPIQDSHRIDGEMLAIQREEALEMVMENLEKSQHSFGVAETLFRQIFNQNKTLGLGDEIDPLRVSQESIKEQGILGGLVPNHYKTGQSTPLQTVTTVTQAIYNRSDEVIKSHLSPLRNTLVNIKKRGVEHERAMRYQLGAFASSYHYGWDLITENGKPVLELTKKNQDKFLEFFGKELRAGTVIPDAIFTAKKQYKPLQMTDEAHALVKRITKAYNEVFDGNRFIDQFLNGQSAKPGGDYYMPYFDILDKEMMLLVDRNGSSLGYVLGKDYQTTLTNANKIAREMGQGTKVIDRHQVHLHSTLRDKAFRMELTDLTNYFQDGGKKGGYITDKINIDDFKFDGIVNDLFANWQNYTRRAVSVVNQNQFKKNDLLKGMLKSTLGETKNYNSAELWESMMLNRPPLKDNMFMMQASEFVENQYKELTKTIYDKLTFANKLSTKQQQQLVDQLKEDGITLPIEYAMENVRQDLVPPTLRQVFNSLNSAATITFLGVLDAMHAALTVTSHFVAAPTVASSMLRRMDESAEDYRNRVKPLGLMLDENVSSPSVSKIMINGIKRAHDDRWLLDAQKYGNLTPFWNEFQTELGSNKLTQNGILKFVTAPTRHSEQYARNISYATGYELADMSSKHGSEALKHAFAHRFANSVIADYSNVNRPTLYQGTLGLPFGLFKTFATNYYSRIFSAIGDKDTRTLLVNYATQGSLFGAQSLPGYSVAEMAYNDADDQRDLNMELVNKLGYEPAELLLSGTVFNFPMLLGGEGIGAIGRTDINPRGNMSDNFNILKTPGIAVVTQTANMGLQLFKAAKAEGFSDVRAAEIVSTYSPLRVVRGGLDLALGYSVNRQGNVTTLDTRTPSKMLSRILGTKTAKEMRTNEAHYKSSRWNRIQLSKQNVVNKNLQALIRKQGGLTGDQLEKLTEAYLKNGGNPEYLGSYFQRQLKQALSTVQSREGEKGRRKHHPIDAFRHSPDVMPPNRQTFNVSNYKILELLAYE